MPQTFVLPKQVVIDPVTGNPAPGAKAYFHITGTSTPKPVYSDAELTTAITQPVVADAAGVLQVIYFAAEGGYKLTLNRSDDTLLYTVDPLGSLTGLTIISTQIKYDITPAETAAGVTPVNYDILSHEQIGEVIVDRYGNNTTPGTTDMTSALAAAILVADQVGCPIRFLASHYKITSAQTIDNRKVTITGMGGCAESTLITYTGTGVFLTIGDATGPYYGVLSGFKLVGTSSADCGIKYSGVSQGVVDDVWIRGFTKSGARGLWLNSANAVNLFILSFTVQNSVIEANYRNLDMTGTSSGTNNIRLVNNKIREALGDYNVYMPQQGFNIVMDGNDLEANGPGYPSVYLNGPLSASINRNYFENTSAAPAIQIFTLSASGVEICNNFMGASVSDTHAINWAGTAYGGVIMGNEIGGWTYAVNLGGSYTDLHIFGNYLNGVLLSDYGGTYVGCHFSDETGKTTIRGGQLFATGGFGTSITSTNATTYSVPATAGNVLYYGAGTSTFTLPTAASGKEITITTEVAQAVNSASSNVKPIDSGTLGTAILTATAGKWAKLVGDGTNWNIMQAN